MSQARGIQCWIFCHFHTGRELAKACDKFVSLARKLAQSRQIESAYQLCNLSELLQTRTCHAQRPFFALARIASAKRIAAATAA